MRRALAAVLVTLATLGLAGCGDGKECPKADRVPVVTYILVGKVLVPVTTYTCDS